MAHVKGIAIRHFVAWLSEYLGSDAMRGVVARLDPEHRARLDPSHPFLGLLAASWYPAPLVHDLMDAIAEGRGELEIDRFVREGTQAALHASLTGTHRALLRVVGSPALHARFAQRLWNTYYDHGRVVSEVASPKRQVITYYDWHAHHTLLCRFTTESDTIIFPAMGLRGVAVRQLCCMSDGAEACSHEVTWS